MASFYNQATLSYNGSTVASNIVSGEILEELSITKTAVSGDYRPGGQLTYVVGIANSGECSSEALTLTDDLGAYELADGSTVVPLDYVAGSLRLFVNGVPQSAPAPTETAPLTLTGLTVPADGSVLLLYQAAVNDYAPLGEEASVTNTVTLSGGPLTEPLTAQATVDADTAPILSVTKTVSPVAVSGSGRLTYSFLLDNRGFTEASGDLVLTDLFDPILKDITVTADGQVWSEGTQFTYDAATGLFTSAQGALTVPAAGAVQDQQTGQWSVVPGSVTLVVAGNL